MPRNIQTMDGNQAAAYVAYAYSEAAAIYPITPSSPMAEYCDEWAASGKQNVFGQTLSLYEMQSEAGVAGALHGILTAGVLGTTFTSSQGLLLMLPVLYRLAGEFLPGVFHVAARTLATHALSIFGDHSDIYACRQTGVAMLAESSVQEVMDLSPLAHLCAIEGRIPFLNFFDGFRTSHELHKIQVWDMEDLREMWNPEAVERFRASALYPDKAYMRGSAQNPDIFFQVREAGNPVYDALPEIISRCFAQINARIGTNYNFFNYYGSPDATHVIVAMGSVCETIREYLNTLKEHSPELWLNYGLVNVHIYRPFCADYFLSVLPTTVDCLTVLNRTKEPGAPGEPLYLDVVAALQNTPFQDLPVFCGRYGLSSKDTTPSQIAAVYENQTKRIFTVGIDDDVTHLSLPLSPLPDTVPEGTISCKFWGLGGDGTVSATKNALKMIGNHTELHVQGYFEYDSKKSRGLTVSHLRFGPRSIHSAYLIHQADLVACHNPVYLHKYELEKDLKDHGTFLLNCGYRGEELTRFLPGSLKRYLAEHSIRFYIIDAVGICKEIGLNNKISTILQAAFFAVSGILPLEKAETHMKEAAKHSYGRQGEKILAMNYQAIERGLNGVTEIPVPDSWRKIADPDTAADTSGCCSCQTKDSPHPLDNKILPCREELYDYVKNLQQPITDGRGNELSVSAFLPYADGSFPSGSSAHERRNVATEIPVWIPENCIQCNRCSFVCPHGVIRPAVFPADETTHLPDGMKTLPMFGMPDYSFAITVSQTDCTGCGSCVGICPGKQGSKALVMQPIHQHPEKQEYFDIGKSTLPCFPAAEKFHRDTVKGSQFLRPLLEFHGACAGCGETPYVKLLSQLYGPRMYIANATGCSSIWANSSPTTAYTVDEEGSGPAWSNSLFENAAEFGFGMLMALDVLQSRGISKAQDWIPWIIGGDGWAYDIGFGGLDHVLASGKNINILVLDTEVYSNTGGQASKATPLGATAKFLSGGKHSAKKDLALMAMTYANVYVAQVAMGANFQQTISALTEAVCYPGPALVIAYATCIAHGIRSGMGSSQHEEKKAVDSGYYQLFRYNPSLLSQGKNPLQLDSPEPNMSYEEFLSNEIRYDVLKQLKPEEAMELFTRASEYAHHRHRLLQKLLQLLEPEQS